MTSEVLPSSRSHHNRNLSPSPRSSSLFPPFPLAPFPDAPRRSLSDPFVCLPVLTRKGPQPHCGSPTARPHRMTPPCNARIPPPPLSQRPNVAERMVFDIVSEACRCPQGYAHAHAHMHQDTARSVATALRNLADSPRRDPPAVRPFRPR